MARKKVEPAVVTDQVADQEPVTVAPEDVSPEYAIPPAPTEFEESTNPVVIEKKEGPVAICRRILAELKAVSPDGVVSRADAVAAFIAAGVNPATSKTQFQRLYKQ